MQQNEQPFSRPFQFIGADIYIYIYIYICMHVHTYTCDDVHDDGGEWIFLLALCC